MPAGRRLRPGDSSKHRLAGRMIEDPELIVVHPATRGRFGISLRLQRYSVFNALLYRKHRQRYRAEIQAWPPISYYAMVVLALVAGVAAAFGASALALVSA